MSIKVIHLVCAARPNFMKIAPLYHSLLKENWCAPKIVHTGQHYDYQMSQAFFDEFNLTAPDHYLSVGSGTHAQQTAQTMIAYEDLCMQKDRPDLVVVVGDVNATLACSVAAKKIHLPVAHLEAGLRSNDRSMPEEINRIVTDAISDYFWTPSIDANENLNREGVAADKISMVGNIMIDTYCMMQGKIEQANKYKQLRLQKNGYVMMTLHRPANVDDIANLQAIMQKIAQIDLPVVFSVHPRTKKNLSDIKQMPSNIILLDPLNYTEFMNLVYNCAYVVSDSGGVQEETTYLGIPCFTLRENTERPVTVSLGTNQLVNLDTLLTAIKNPKRGSIPPLWDGNTASRVNEQIKHILC